MAKKKTLYEILELPHTASYAEVQVAYQTQLQVLDSQQAMLDRDDYNLKLRVLKVAYSTLSAPSSRDAYDASLAMAASETAAPELTLQPMAPPAVKATDAALRAEVMALRAETMALRVDALGLKADAVSRTTGYRPNMMNAGSVAADLARPASTLLRSVLLAMGVVVALAMVVKLFYMFTAPSGVELETQRRSAQDKVYLQDYFQTHGVRPASMAEAAQLDAQRQEKQALQTEQRLAKEQQKSSVDQERKFEEDARKRAAQVSAELEISEEKSRRMRESAEFKEEQEKRRAEDIERNRVESERRRAEYDQEKWRRIIVSPSRN